MTDYTELIKALREATGWQNASKHYVLMKQAADAIEELLPYKSVVERGQGLLEKAQELLDALRPRWIPVTERLPENEKDVLAYYGFEHDGELSKRRFMGILEYFVFDTTPHWQHESHGLRVTHWMHLPQPPKEET